MSSTVKPFTYEVDPDFDYILDEKGNTYTALRKIRWGDREDFKLDVRKYYATEEGERMSKGCSLSDEAADEAVKVLLSTGYGDDREVAKAIIDNERLGIIARIVDEVNSNDILRKKVESEDISSEDEELYDLDEVV